MKKHILVIDEGRLMCYGLKKALTHENTAVDTAFTVSEAVKSHGLNSYDLCLFDVCPPDDKGLGLMEMIRNSWPEIKIILMTASDITLYDDAKGIMHKAKTNGACHLLCKPFDLKMLQDVVFKTLNEDGDDPWFCNNFLLSSRRSGKRQEWCRKINFSLKVITDGEVKRLNFPAESVNISEDGIVLITSRLLKPSEVISFDDELHGRAGVVMWSSQLDEQRYKAGIRFA